MKFLMMLIMFLSFNTCSYGQPKKGLSITDQFKDQRLKLRNDAFCHCMWRVDSSTLTLHLNDASAAGFKAYMAYDEDMIPDLKVFTLEWVSKNEKNYRSYDNSPLTTMKCLDYYNSEELKNFVVKQDKRIDKEILKMIYEK